MLCSGDKITMVVDMNAGTLSFKRNALSLGTAFSGLRGQSLQAAVCFGGCGPGSSSAAIFVVSGIVCYRKHTLVVGYV